MAGLENPKPVEDTMDDDQLEAVIADALEDYDRVNWGRWRLKVNEETIISPFTTAEVAHSVAKHIREAEQ